MQVTHLYELYEQIPYRLHNCTYCINSQIPYKLNNYMLYKQMDPIKVTQQDLQGKHTNHIQVTHLYSSSYRTVFMEHMQDYNLKIFHFQREGPEPSMGKHRKGEIKDGMDVALEISFPNLRPWQPITCNLLIYPCIIALVVSSSCDCVIQFLLLV